jgi:DNA methylase
VTIITINADFRALDPDTYASCDVMITDPPYSEHVHSNAVSTRTGGVGPRDRDLGFEHLSPEDRGFLACVASSVQRWSIVFCDLESTHLWRQAMADAGVEYVREFSYIRWSQPQVTGDRPCTGAEAILHFHSMHPYGPRGGAPKPKAKAWNGYGGWTHYASKALRGDGKHPTEKPLDLMLTLVASFSNPGDTVVDPCAGAGTTGLACLLLDRDCVLVEQNTQWAERAETRCSTLDGFTKGKEWARAADWVSARLGEIRGQWGGKDEPALDAIDRPSWDRSMRMLDAVQRVAKVCEMKVGAL